MPSGVQHPFAFEGKRLDPTTTGVVVTKRGQDPEPKRAADRSGISKVEHRTISSRSVGAVEPGGKIRDWLPRWLLGRCYSVDAEGEGEERRAEGEGASSALGERSALNPFPRHTNATFCGTQNRCIPGRGRTHG
jgi:hypothetical protein